MPKNTLNKKKEFDQIFKTGRSFYCPILGLKVLKNNLNYNRYGIIIGLKVSKSAVTRNKIKRQIREIIRREFPQTESFYDIVIIVIKEIVDKDFLDIRSELLSLVKKIK